MTFCVVSTCPACRTTLPYPHPRSVRAAEVSWASLIPSTYWTSTPINAITGSHVLTSSHPPHTDGGGSRRHGEQARTSEPRPRRPPRAVSNRFRSRCAPWTRRPSYAMAQGQASHPIPTPPPPPSPAPLDLISTNTTLQSRWRRMAAVHAVLVGFRGLLRPAGGDGCL